MTFPLWSAPQTRVPTTVHTTAALNKSVLANPDKDAFFIIPLSTMRPFIPSAAAQGKEEKKKKRYKLQANAPIAFQEW